MVTEKQKQLIQDEAENNISIKALPFGIVKSSAILGYKLGALAATEKIAHLEEIITNQLQVINAYQNL